MKDLFLDANAHVPINKKAMASFMEFSSSIGSHGHPSTITNPGKIAAVKYEEAREKIASLLGAKSANQIIFTSGCSQACEWAIEILQNKNENKTSITFRTPFEHAAVEKNFTQYKYHKKNGRKLIIDGNGLVIPNLWKSKRFNDFQNFYKKVCCIHLHNETGVIQPVEKFNCDYLFSDMSQSLGKIPVSVTDLNIDLAVFGAHKFGGFSSIGFIYLKNPEDWVEFGYGSRYFNDRVGTPDVAAAVSSAVALEEALSTLPERTTNMIAFRNVIEDFLNEKGYEIIGQKANRCPNTAFVNIPGKALEILIKLNDKGIYTGLGSACGSMHSGPSRTIKALGRTGGSEDYLRISQFGEYGEKEGKYFIDCLKGILEEIN